MLLSHFGVLASSKSAMNTLAPELSALMIILRSTGPVISTRRSAMSAGTGAHSPVALRGSPRVSGRKSGSLPASSSAWRAARRASRLVTPVAERALQPGDERQRLRRQDLGVLGRDGAGNFDAGAIGTRGHGGLWHGICGAQSECVVSRKKGSPAMITDDAALRQEPPVSQKNAGNSASVEIARGQPKQPIEGLAARHRFGAC